MASNKQPRSITPSIAVCQRVELGIGPRQDTRWYSTRVEDEDGSGQRLTVGWPTEHGQLIGVGVGQQLELAASAPEDALYATRVRVAAAQATGVPMLELEVVGGWQRLQRREAVRANVTIRTSLAERLEPGERTLMRVDISNISATGVQVRSQDKLWAGDRLRLVFALGDSPGQLDLVAEVQRPDVIQEGGMRGWEAGCRFVAIEPAQAEQIVQFIFARQRALARARR